MVPVDRNMYAVIITERLRLQKEIYSIRTINIFNGATQPNMITQNHDRVNDVKCIIRQWTCLRYRILKEEREKKQKLGIVIFAFLYKLISTKPYLF